MTEHELIGILTKGMPRSVDQVNAAHECDAEIVRLGDRLWAFTTDEFSPEEDLFFDADPARIGRTVAAATLSDLLAAGAETTFFMQSVCLPPDAPGDFAAGLAEGVAQVLKRASCALLGGDVGLAPAWRFTGFAFGPIPEERPLTRRLPGEPCSLWVTGPLGGANAAAVRREPPPEPVLPLTCAAAIRQSAAACIDTSGGLLDALWQMAACSPKTDLRVELDAIPLAPGVRETAERLGIPAETALVGGAGEYELVFALCDGAGAAAVSRLQRLGAFRIGTAVRAETSRITFLRNQAVTGIADAPPPCPRAARSREAYLKDIVREAARLAGHASPPEGTGGAP